MPLPRTAKEADAELKGLLGDPASTADKLQRGVFTQVLRMHVENWTQHRVDSVTNLVAARITKVCKQHCPDRLDESLQRLHSERDAVLELFETRLAETEQAIEQEATIDAIAQVNAALEQEPVDGAQLALGRLSSKVIEGACADLWNQNREEDAHALAVSAAIAAILDKAATPEHREAMLDAVTEYLPDDYPQEIFDFTNWQFLAPARSEPDVDKRCTALGAEDPQQIRSACRHLIDIGDIDGSSRLAGEALIGAMRDRKGTRETRKAMAEDVRAFLPERWPADLGELLPDCEAILGSSDYSALMNPTPSS